MSRWHKANAKRWRAARLSALTRDNWQCQLCGKQLGLAEVDHIIPLHRGGDEWNPENHQTTCRSCHRTKTLAERPGPPPDPERKRWKEYLLNNATDIGTLVHTDTPTHRHRGERMTPKKLLEIRQSEIRQRLAQLAETDPATPETETEIAGLSKEYQAAEVRMQAMIIADDKPEPVAVETRENGDPADREYRNMVDRSNLGTLLQNIMENRNHDGALAELQKHHGLAGNQIPLALLTDREVRAATPIPGEIQQTQRMIVPPVYATGDAAFLMIPQVTVPAGDSVWPIMSNRANVGGRT